MIRLGRVSTMTRGPVRMGWVEDLLNYPPGNKFIDDRG